MEKSRKKVLICTASVFLLLIAIAVVYFFQFNALGYRMTVPYRSAFVGIDNNIYINRYFSGSREEAIVLIDSAKERAKEFFGDLCCLEDTVIIICDDDLLLSKLGGDHDTRTIYFPAKKHYISVSDEYCNIDILAHELTHAELHTRLSVSAQKKIPTWFDEGIALQNDYREQYSFETWIEQTDNGSHTVALEDMDEASEFYAGTVEDRRFRYMNAKHEVSKWLETHKRQGLMELINKLNNGEAFLIAYNG